ncbi:MAG: glycosyltransferase family 39 protein [Rudaea sp.]
MKKRLDAAFLPLLAVAVGFLFRLDGLAAQSLWNDEGTSVALARLSLPSIADGAAHDIHPPLYYFFLHFWMGLSGESEFAVRFLSVIAGVLLIVVTARLALELFGRRVAALAALLSALAAFEVYYSQETRMYIWVALWGALSFWAMLRLLDRPSFLRMLLYIVFAVAALYTHYFAPTLLLAQGLAVAVWLAIGWRTEGRFPLRAGLSFILAWAIIGLAFLPWLVYAGNQLSSWPAISERLSLPDLSLRILSAFVLGIDSPAGGQALIVALFGLLFLAGLLPGLRAAPLGDKRSHGLRPSPYFPVLLCALWALVPLAFMYAVSFQRPAYNPKFLLLAAPAFFILVARGLALLAPASLNFKATRIARAAPFLIACLLALAGGWIALQGIYSDPRLQRDDYRGVIGYINSNARTDDAVLVDAPGQMDVFRYYYRGAAQVFALPTGRPLDDAATRSGLTDLTQVPGDIFAVLWATEQADPEKLVERTLSQSRFKAVDEWHGNIRFAQYGGPSAAGIDLLPVPVYFADEIELQSVTAFGSDAVRSGRVLSLRLEWQAQKHPASNYKVFVQLLDTSEKIVSQRDAEPADGFRPTGSWSAGESVEDNVGLLVRPGTAAGDYRLILGLYRPENLVRLPVSSGGDHVDLGRVQIKP